MSDDEAPPAPVSRKRSRVDADDDNVPPPPSSRVAKLEAQTSTTGLTKVPSTSSAKSKDDDGPAQIPLARAKSSSAPPTPVKKPSTPQLAPATSTKVDAAPAADSKPATPVATPKKKASATPAKVEKPTGKGQWQFKVDLRKKDNVKAAWEDYKASDNTAIERNYLKRFSSKKNPPEDHHWRVWSPLRGYGAVQEGRPREAAPGTPGGEEVKTSSVFALLVVTFVERTISVSHSIVSMTPRGDFQCATASPAFFYYGCTLCVSLV